MSILIKGMEMPEKCADCLFIDYFKGQWYCHSINDILETGTSKRDERCNLVPVPPHGDLIDAQEQMRLMQSCEYDTYDDYNRAFDMLDTAPTIIPAEEGET